LRTRILEFLLVVCSLCVTAALAEVTFSLVGLPYVPLRLHRDLPRDIQVFAQTSKAGVLPRDPVVLLGDSYAQGYGDWLGDVYRHGNKPFHSAHVINKLIGRDVVTLGEGGAGSAEGVAAYPALAYRYADKAWYLRFPRPHSVVIYFYEGNDLNDNMRFLASYAPAPDTADLAGEIDRALAAYPAVLAIHPGWARHLPLLRFMAAVAWRRFFENPPGQANAAPASIESTPAPRPERPNVVEVAGHAVDLPAILQSPPLEMSHAQMQQAALVFERSLVFLRTLLPSTPVLVVYLPSPLATYRLRSPQVSIEKYPMAGPAGPFPREQVSEYSDVVCLLIRGASIGQQVGFFDLRPAIRATASRELVHGPHDFRHFNKKGMEVLGREVAERIDRPPTQEPCARGAA
jgi:hypothetical protein